MAKNGIKWFDADEHARKNDGVNVHFVVGGRGIGKSYALAKRAIEAFLNGNQVLLVRDRYEDTSSFCEWFSHVFRNEPAYYHKLCTHYGIDASEGPVMHRALRPAGTISFGVTLKDAVPFARVAGMDSARKTHSALSRGIRWFVVVEEFVNKEVTTKTLPRRINSLVTILESIAMRDGDGYSDELLEVWAVANNPPVIPLFLTMFGLKGKIKGEQFDFGGFKAEYSIYGDKTIADKFKKLNSVALGRIESNCNYGGVGVYIYNIIKGGWYVSGSPRKRRHDDGISMILSWRELVRHDLNSFVFENEQVRNVFFKRVADLWV